MPEKLGRLKNNRGGMMTWRIATLYHFACIDDPGSKQAPLKSLCDFHGVRGSLLLAGEGINGTIAGPDAGIAAVISHLEEWPEITGLEVKYSSSSSPGFLRMKVRLKNEIVTMGKAGINPAIDTGQHIDPKDWNDLIRRQDVMVVDTRNHYETRIGRFDRAVDPMTNTFKEFPGWAEALAADPERPRAVAMYCTGGIRCEKASAYMKILGFEEVYHLRGGILKYLEDIPREDSLWQGDCFVFDERVSLRHGLAEGDYELCYACKEPISTEDLMHEDYERGVSCPHCISSITPEQRIRFRERQRQIDLARLRGEEHMGNASANARRAPGHPASPTATASPPKQR